MNSEPAQNAYVSKVFMLKKISSLINVSQILPVFTGFVIKISAPWLI
jgi:hypothetical protein